jgi:hypothetical protein
VRILDKVQADKAVKKEISRLKKLYRDIPPKRKALVDGLIGQAARLRVSLNQLWDDIVEKGDTEWFTQSEKTDPYERERPCARLFNARDKNYQSIIKLLNDQLPDDTDNDPGEELMKFVARGGK